MSAGPVTNDHVLALRDAEGPDPVLVCRPDGTVSIEPDATEAQQAGYRLIARRSAASGQGVYPFPEAVAVILSGVVAGTVHYVGADGRELDRNPFL